MAKKAKKLSRLSPVEKLVVLRQLIKDGHRQNHRAQMIMSVMGINLPMDRTEADHAILALMAKGNKRLAR